MWNSFDVGAVVDSLGRATATVAAGSSGLGRSVSRVQLVARSDDLLGSGRDELVVTTADVLLAAASGPVRLIGELELAGVAGAAIRLGRGGSLPQEVVVAADSCNFPLLTFPEATALSEVTTLVLNALLDAQGKRLERVLDIHQRFTPVVLAGGGVAEIAEILHDVVACPIMIVDTQGKSMLSLGGPAVGDHAVGDLADGDPARSEDALQRFPILAGDHGYGEIIVETAGATLDDDQVLAIQRASIVVAARLAHASAVAAEQDRFAATTLEELIAGTAHEVNEVVERAISFGWDLTRRRAVLLASIDPPINSETLPRAMATIGAAARATLGPAAIVWARSSTIAALISPESDAPVERRRLAEALRHELDRRLHTVNVSIGVGCCVESPFELRQSLLQASRSVDVGRWVKGRHVTEVFDELGLERLLTSASPDDLAEFVAQAIGPLLDHDRTHRTNLVETLGLWLECRNTAEASRRLFVHYNTLKNRLERIEAILGSVLHTPARALECQVAIHVFHHYDGPWFGDAVSLS